MSTVKNGKVTLTLILDHLLQIHRLETQAEKENYAIGLYKVNKRFAQLCDLAYSRSQISRYADGRELPKYKPSKQPYGMDFSALERIYNKFKISGFRNGSKSELADNIAKNKLIQVFEAVSDVEVAFLKEVLSQEISFLPLHQWQAAKFKD